MEYKTKSGCSLTDADLERMGEEAEKGIYPGEPGKMIVAPPGRPALCDEGLVTIAFKVPRSYRDRLDEKASSQHKTRSQFLRSALEQALR